MVNKNKINEVNSSINDENTPEPVENTPESAENKKKSAKKVSKAAKKEGIPEEKKAEEAQFETITCVNCNHIFRKRNKFWEHCPECGNLCRNIIKSSKVKKLTIKNKKQVKKAKEKIARPKTGKTPPKTVNKVPVSPSLKPSRPPKGVDIAPGATVRVYNKHIDRLFRGNK